MVKLSENHRRQASWPRVSKALVRLAGLTSIFLIGAAAGAGLSSPAGSYAAYDKCGARFYAHVNDARGTCAFPRNGFRWLQKKPAANLWRSTDKCKQPQVHDMRIKFNQQLAGTGGGFSDAFATEWPTGMDLTQQPQDSSGDCLATGTINQNSDIHLDWKTRSQWYDDLNRDDYGAVTTSTLGSQNWCDIWDVSYPCGIHISRIELNEFRFDNHYSDAYGTKVLVHESGHSMGFNDLLRRRAIGFQLHI